MEGTYLENSDLYVYNIYSKTYSSYLVGILLNSPISRPPMPQSLSKVFIHIVFSTKCRKPQISVSFENELFKIIGGKIRSMGGSPIIINGTQDHIHILAILPRTISISSFVKGIKTGSTIWIRSSIPGYKNFRWQNGFGAFSVSERGVNAVKSYIENQKEHHKKSEFKKEFKRFLKENDIDYDERYLWD